MIVRIIKWTAMLFVFAVIALALAPAIVFIFAIFALFGGVVICMMIAENFERDKGR